MSTNVNLAQAIAAARAGKTAQARILVDRILQEEPENANAWFLLSTIAETEEEQLASLEKVLEIDPSHEAAAARVSQISLPAEPVDTVSYAEAVETPAVETPAVEAPAAMEEEVEEAFAEFEAGADMAAETLITAAPLVVSEEPLDFVAQEAGDTVPAWMADEGEGLLTTMPVTPAEEAPAEPAELPDWLQEEPGEGWQVEEEAAVAQGKWEPGDEVPGAADTTVEEARAAAKAAAPRPRPRAKAPASDQSSLLLVVLIALAVIVALALIYVLVARPL